jgi:hypothetical protein
MTKSRGPMNASELMEQLANDPVRQAAIAKREAELAVLRAGWRAAEAPLVAELQAAGYDVDSAWNLISTTVPYPDALPILVDHLSRDYPDRVREGIARALAVRAAVPWWPELRDYYMKATGPDAKSALAVAVSVTVTKATLSEYIDLIKDPANGSSRVLLVRALKRLRDPRGLAVLEELRNDPVLSQEVGRTLAGRSPNS